MLRLIIDALYKAILVIKPNTLYDNLQIRFSNKITTLGLDQLISVIWVHAENRLIRTKPFFNASLR